MTDQFTTRCENMVKETLSKYANLADNNFFGTVDDWKFSIEDLTSLPAYGICNLYTREIKLCSVYCSVETWDDIEDTILHECAHALAGIEISPKGRRMGHGKLWKSWASLLGASPIARKTSPNFHNYAEQKKSKYCVVTFVNDEVEIHFSCNRKLKKLQDRYYPDKPYTLNNMYHVHMNDFESYKHDIEKLKSVAFR